MESRGIAINDLYVFALPQLDQIQNDRDVHFSETGSAVLGARVAEVIRQALPQQSTAASKL